MSKERRINEATEKFNEMMMESFMDSETVEQAMMDHEERIREIQQNGRHVTGLWPNDLKHALARVVSLVSRAGARDSAAWSKLWERFERTEAHAQRLADAATKVVKQGAIDNDDTRETTCAVAMQELRKALEQWKKDQ